MRVPSAPSFVRFFTRVLALATVVAVALALASPSRGTKPLEIERTAVLRGGNGYWLTATDGGVFSFGPDAPFYGSTGNIRLNQPIVGMTASPTGAGYWFVASDGGIFSFGDAQFFGSTGNIRLNQPIVGMAATPTGKGYWLVASDGGIFAFGDAQFFGSTGNIRLNQPIVGMAATPTGKGYWFVARDGGIFSFGDAQFFGSTGNIRLNEPIVGMAASPFGDGYWFVARDGGIFSFGDAPFYGSTGDLDLPAPIVDMESTPTGEGYWFVGADGEIYDFGDAPFLGSTGDIQLNKPVVGMAAAPAFLVDDVPVANDDTFTLTEDTQSILDVLANDEGLSDGDLTMTIVSEPTKGTVSIRQDGTIRYIPNPNATGADSFVYDVGDIDDQVDEATVNVTITPVNDAPTISAIGNRTIDEDGTTGPIAFTVADVDDASSALTLTATSSNTTVVPTANITFGGSNGNRTVTVSPAANQSGASTITVRVADGAGAAATEPFTLTVTAVNDAPTIDSATGPTLTNDSTPTFTGTASDSEGDAIAAIEVAVDGGAFSSAGVTGTSSFSWTPATPLPEGSRVIHFRATDGNGATSAVVSRTVEIDLTDPTVTVEQATGQLDPTNDATIDFTVVFSEPVTGFAADDVTIGGNTAGTESAAVTGSGTTYAVAVTGHTGPGNVTATIALDRAVDAAGNGNAASTSTDNSVVFDNVAPSVTINQAAGQNDPTNGNSVSFTAVFDEPVTGFDASDVILSGPGATAATPAVTGTGPTYTVTVTGISDGAITAAIPAAAATDLAGNTSTAATSTDATVTRETGRPTVTLSKAASQEDPTDESSIEFVADFSEDVVGFTGADVTIGGTTTGTKSAAVSGGPKTYTITITNHTGNGTVTVEIPVNRVDDAAGNNNLASNVASVVYDSTPPTFTGLSVTSGSATVIATFSEVLDCTTVAAGDFTATVNSLPTTVQSVECTAPYDDTVALTLGTAPTGTQVVSITRTALGQVSDRPGNTSSGSESRSEEAPAVTVTAPPDNASTNDTTPTFTGTVADGSSDAISALEARVDGVGAFSTSGVTGTSTWSWTPTAPLSAAAHYVEFRATDATGSVSSVVRRDFTVDLTAPTVTANQADGQADPTGTSPINFTVAFSEPVTGFANADVTVGGTAGATTAVVSGTGPYNVAVSGMTGNGTVTITIPAGAASDAAGNASAASTSTDNSVTWDKTGPTATINQAAGQPDPTNESTIDFTVVFSEPVTGFASDDITIAGSAAGDKTVDITQVNSTTYAVAVTGQSSQGTVIASLAAGRVTDALGNGNTAATSTDNTVTYDPDAPTVTINQATAQTDPTNDSVIDFTVVFSEPVTDFVASDVAISGTAGGSRVVGVSGSGTTYAVTVTGATDGTVIADIAAGAAVDAAGNTSAQSSSTDNTVTYDGTRPSTTAVVAITQENPTDESSIEFTVTFSEAVTGFANGEVTLGGTAPGTLVGVVTGSGTTYTVTVTGHTGDGTVTLSVPAGIVTDAATNTNTASTVATATYDNTDPKIDAVRLTNTDATSNITWDAIGDQLTITWTEAVSHSAGNTTLSEAQVEAILGTGIAYAGPLPAASTVTLAGSGTDTWTLTIGAAALSNGIVVGDSTNGTSNGAVTDPAGNAQVLATGEAFQVGPNVVSVELTASDPATASTWNAVGDVLTIVWSEAATNTPGGNAAINEAQVEAILGSPLAYGVGSTVTVAGSGTTTWTLTVGGTALSEGVAIADAVNGTNNAGVTDAGGAPQVPTAGVTVGDDVAPRLLATRLTTSNATTGDADNVWNEAGEVLTLVWSESTTRVGTDPLSEAALEAILGTTVQYAGTVDVPTSTVTVGGSGTDTWTLTIGGTSLVEGIAENDATNGTANANAKDAADKTQVAASGVTFGVGPRIATSRITSSTDATWDAVGDALTITWNENATRTGGNGVLTEAQVEELLGTTVTHAGSSTVTLAGSGTPTWTLTIGGAALTEGITEGDATNGTNNAVVTDAAANPQVPSVGRTVGAGPRISNVRLTATDAATNTSWNAVGDVLTVTWNEAATRTGGNGVLTEAQVEELLGTTVTHAGSSTVTLAGSGTATWTLTIGGAALTEGITEGDATNGTNSAAVTDSAGNQQLASSGVTLTAGPRISDTDLTANAGSLGFKEVGDVLTISWNEAATRTAGGTSLSEAEVVQLLGATVDYAASSTITFAGNTTATWTLTIGGADLVDGIADNDPTPGSNNAAVENNGDPQLPGTATFDVGPAITATRLTSSTGANTTWDAVTEVLTVIWNEPATRTGGNGTVAEADLEAILGTAVAYTDGILSDSVVTLAGSGTSTWTLTIGTEPLVEGIAETDSTNGTNNTAVTNSGDRQVTTTGVAMNVGPRIATAKITTSDLGTPASWNAVGDVLTITWNENATRTAGNGTLSEAQVEAITGATLAYGTNTTVTLAGSGTNTWTLTIGGEALDEGVSVGDGSNGTNNAAVTDAAGAPQVLTSGVTVGDTVAPRIVATRLTNSTDGDNIWDAVGDVITVTWSENASRGTGNGPATEEQVEAILGTTVQYGTGSTVQVGGSGTSTWTLSVGGTAGLTEGVVDGDATNGSTNAAVTDSATNQQVAATGVTFGVGPRIATTRITSSTDGTWDAVGDVLTVTWNEAATRTGGNGSLSASDVSSILGNTVTYAGSSTVTLSGSGTSTWTLTVGGASLTDGVSDGGATNGTNNAAVADAAGNPQVITIDVTAGAGPRITSARLTSTDGATNTSWNAVGDVVTIGWTENATRTGGNGTLSKAQVEAILGTPVTYGGTSTVTLAGSGTQTWTLTIGVAALTEGVNETDAVNGTDNNAVTDSSSNPQTPTTGVTLTAGPRIADTDLTTNAGALGFTEIGDVLTVTWNEAATRAGGDGTLTELQLEAILGTPVAYAGSSTVTLAGSGTDTWTLTIAGADLTEGIADNDPTPGTNNAAVTNSGDPQLPSAATFDVGPAITATRLTSSTGANTTWDAVSEVLTITWNEAATRAGGDGTLTEAEVEAILGTAVQYTDALTDTTVTLVGSGTNTWTLTIGVQPLAEGVAENDQTTGSSNAAVTNGGDRQVATTGVAMNVGPRISSARLTTGLGSWSAVGNVITITWTEDAVWAPATSTLSEPQVEAILGTSIVYGANTTVTLAGSGTGSWTLTIGGEALDEGITLGDSTNGTNNTSVVDEHPVVPAPQLLTTGKTLTLV